MCATAKYALIGLHTRWTIVFDARIDAHADCNHASLRSTFSTSCTYFYHPLGAGLIHWELHIKGLIELVSCDSKAPFLVMWGVTKGLVVTAGVHNDKTCESCDTWRDHTMALSNEVCCSVSGSKMVVVSQD